MKKFTIILTVLFLFNACMSTNPNEDNPPDLEGKKALLAEKQSAHKKLQEEITRLEKEIGTLEPAAEKPKRLVTTATAERKDFRHYVEIQGTVQSDDFVNATSEVAGRIMELPVKEGQPIKKGQLIARLDMEQVNKQIAELEKSLELAVDVYDRQKRLWDQNIGSEMQYLQAKNNKERIEKSLETVKFQLTKSKVYAPISGVVELINLKSGEVAAPGVPVVQILNTNKVKIVANVPENYLQSVKKGELVKVKFPALDIEKEARISLIGSTINPANRTFEVEVTLPNPKGLFKPNLLSIMIINDISQDNMVMIPLELVQQEVSGKDYVLIAEKSEEGLIAKKVYVKTGESFAGEIVIEEGLESGETLIVEGARGMSEGELIKVAN